MTLTLQNISFERNQAALFQQLDFVLQTGELLQITGVNGSGKSTLLRILAGFIEPQEGNILWQGKNILKQRENYQQAICYLGHLNGIKSNLTAYENLYFFSALAAHKASRQDIIYVIDFMGLKAVAHAPAFHLSAGQLRRLSLARLLLNSAALWILDEPTTALDNEGQILLAELLDQHKIKNGLAVVATHQKLLVKAESKILRIGGVI